MAFLAQCIRNIKVKKEGARERGRESEQESEKVLLGGFPTGTHSHQSDEQEYAPGGQDDV